MPPPPPPADCASFGVTDQPGQFTLTITSACGLLPDDTLTVTNRRTESSFQVSIGTDGASQPTLFGGVAVGDDLRFHGATTGCTKSGCFRFGGIGPAAECVAPEEFVGDWQWQTGATMTSDCFGGTQGDLIGTIELSIDGEGDLHAAAGPPFLACEATLELDGATARPARVKCITLNVEEFSGGSRARRITDTFGEAGLTLDYGGATMHGDLEVRRHVEDLDDGSVSDCVLRYQGVLARVYI